MISSTIHLFFCIIPLLITYAPTKGSMLNAVTS
jgi:hypothetical protein